MPRPYPGPADIALTRHRPGEWHAAILPRRYSSTLPVPAVFPDRTSALRAACTRAARLGYTVAIITH